MEVDLEWSFNQAFGNAVFVENARGENSFGTRHEQHDDVIYVEPDENDANGNNEALEEGVDAAQDVALLKTNGAAKYENGDYGGALKDFNRALIIEPQCLIVLQYRAVIKRILNQFKDALKDLNLADELQPNNVFTLSTRGTVYKELKDYPKALQDLIRANELDNRNSFVKIQLGVVRRSMGQFEEALTDLNAANFIQSDHAFVLAQRGTVKREMGWFEDAKMDLDRAHQLDPSDGFVYHQRGVVRRELGDLEGALEDLNQAVKLIPNDSYTLRRRGVTKRELLDYRGSLDDLNMANTLELYNDFTLSERGVTKMVLRDFQGAFRDLNMANHIKPYQAFTLKHRGSVSRELGNLNDALQDLTYADNLEPYDFFTLFELGKVKDLSQDYEGALAHYNTVVKMVPDDPTILQQRGSLKRMTGDCVGSLEDLNKAEEIMRRPGSMHNNTIPTLMERCFTKYAMKDVAGALEDAKVVRELRGTHGQSFVKGEKLKLATTQSASGPSEHASSMTQRLPDIAKSTPWHPILWIENSRLVFSGFLGKGSFGYVHKCKWVDGNRDVAVKYVSSQIKPAFEWETRMLANIRHPRIVQLIGCSYDDKGKQGLLVMELMQQNLRSLINSKKPDNGQPFDLPVAVDIMDKIAEAMAYLHDQGVLHRDLKSTNILVNKCVDGKEKYVVKIADFGMAKLQENNSMPYFMTMDVGATLWRAPEVFKSDGCRKYSYSADVWSYGITCSEILTGEVPFEGVPHAQIRQKVLSGLRPVLPASCPNILKSLVTKCWSLMPLERPTFVDIHKTLKLYLGRDSMDPKAGDVIGPQDFQRFF